MSTFSNRNGTVHGSSINHGQLYNSCLPRQSASSFIFRQNYGSRTLTR
jgi:hypothetical protein